MPTDIEGRKLHGQTRIAPAIFTSKGERTLPSIPPRSFRLQELFARLRRCRRFESFDDAYEGLVSVLEAVEDELTGVENNPAKWRIDGRLYPPQMDNWLPVAGYSWVTRMRARGHNVFIAANGAIEIRLTESEALVLSKAGSDGRKVWDP